LCFNLKYSKANIIFLDDLQTCCGYYALMFWVSIVKECEDECTAKGEFWDPSKFPEQISNANSTEIYRIADCCFRTCLLRRAGILVYSIDPNVRPWVSPEGITTSFFFSTQNNSLWEPVIRTAVNRCCNDFADATYGYDCNVIPYSLTDITNCCYKEIYMKCPEYTFKEPRCQEAYDWVQECFPTYD
jgi:hypothetical protein